MKFTIPGQPQGKGRAKFARMGAYVKTYTPQQTASYENLIKLFYKKAFPSKPLTVAPLKITIKAYYLIPISWSNKKRLKAIGGDIRPTVKPDADNVIKVVCDALNGIAYTDDKQVVEMRCVKIYDVAPRVEVLIEEIS